MGKVAQTPFLKLSNWVGEDSPQRIDFVGDNLKIDEFAKAIKQETLNLQLEKANALDLNELTQTVKGDYLKKTDLPTNVSHFKNDAGYVTTDELGNIDLTYLEDDIAELERDKANKSYVDAELKGKSTVGHNHDSTYSKIGHTHTQYASKAEVDAVKNLGVESNKVLVDALNSKDVSASTSDGVLTNSKKVNNIIHATGVAQDYHVLANQTYSNKYGNNKRGSMTNHGSLNKTITKQNESINIGDGYYSGGQVKANITNLRPENIRKDVSVGGVVGSLQTVSNAIKNIDTSKTEMVRAGEKKTFRLSSEADAMILVCEGRGVLETGHVVLDREHGVVIREGFKYIVSIDSISGTHVTIRNDYKEITDWVRMIVFTLKYN